MKAHPNVKGYIEDPEEGSSVDLIVGLGELSKEELAERVGNLGGEYRRELDFGFHLVSIPEVAVSKIYEIGGIETVEADEDVEEYDTGKSKSPHVSDL